jgi:hypothetical protein
MGSLKDFFNGKKFLEQKKKNCKFFLAKVFCDGQNDLVNKKCS